PKAGGDRPLNGRADDQYRRGQAIPLCVVVPRHATGLYAAPTPHRSAFRWCATDLTRSWALEKSSRCDARAGSAAAARWHRAILHRASESSSRGGAWLQDRVTIATFQRISW